MFITGKNDAVLRNSQFKDNRLRWPEQGAYERSKKITLKNERANDQATDLPTIYCFLITKVLRLWH
jgi:hypothetical protein